MPASRLVERITKTSRSAPPMTVPRGFQRPAPAPVRGLVGSGTASESCARHTPPMHGAANLDQEQNARQCGRRDEGCRRKDRRPHAAYAHARTATKTRWQRTSPRAKPPNNATLPNQKPTGSCRDRTTANQAVSYTSSRAPWRSLALLGAHWGSLGPIGAHWGPLGPIGAH